MATGCDLEFPDRQVKKRKIATDDHLTLTDLKIADLAQIIVSKHMATIAIKYLGIPYETVENLKLVRQNDLVASTGIYCFCGETRILGSTKFRSVFYTTKLEDNFVPI